MKIALIAHDRKKDNLIQFAIAYRDILAEHDLYATGTTGTMIEAETRLTDYQVPFRPTWGRPANWCDDRQ